MFPHLFRICQTNYLRVIPCFHTFGPTNKTMDLLKENQPPLNLNQHITKIILIYCLPYPLLVFKWGEGEWGLFPFNISGRSFISSSEKKPIMTAIGWDSGLDIGCNLRDSARPVPAYLTIKVTRCKHLKQVSINNFSTGYLQLHVIQHDPVQKKCFTCMQNPKRIFECRTYVLVTGILIHLF